MTVAERIDSAEPAPEVRPRDRTIAGWVEALRDQSRTDAPGARDAAWDWFISLGRQAEYDRSEAAVDLATLFAAGIPSRGLDGSTDGILVTTLVRPSLDRAVRAITARWMPWMGKRFHAAAARGDNRLRAETRWLTPLVWPLYVTRPAPDGRIAFDFETRIEPGALAPSGDVLVIDYAPVATNPRLIIRRIRDELVEIVPGAHLGRILFRVRGGYQNLGYFALRNPLVTPARA